MHHKVGRRRFKSVFARTEYEADPCSTCCPCVMLCDLTKCYEYSIAGVWFKRLKLEYVKLM